MSRYQSLVPLFLAKRFLEGNSYPTDVPFIERYRCSAAFVDISGYSKITSAFDELNTAVELSGAEKVTSLLNDFLDLLFSFTSLYGGDVVKFAGDALLICFFEDDKNSNSEETPTRLVRRACRCALQFQNALEEASCGSRWYRLAFPHRNWIRGCMVSPCRRSLQALGNGVLRRRIVAGVCSDDCCQGR